MSNWYKIARRGTDRPLMDEYSENGKSGDEVSFPETLTKANPFFGGNERTTSDGKGYPKGISQNEDNSDRKNVEKELPAGRTQLDDEIYQGEGANDDRFMDDRDKPHDLQRLDPEGPHNMNKTIFDSLRRRRPKFIKSV